MSLSVQSYVHLGAARPSNSSCCRQQRQGPAAGFSSSILVPPLRHRFRSKAPRNATPERYTPSIRVARAIVRAGGDEAKSSVWSWFGLRESAGAVLGPKPEPGSAEHSSQSWGADTEFSSGSPWFEDDDITILHSERSEFNNIKVLEVSRRSDNELAGAKVLLLDAPGNIHSIYFPFKPWTDSYYDRFAALPPLLPPHGPIGILGLGAGSAARAISYAWPDVNMVGWEWDPAVIQVARQFFDLRDLEPSTKETSTYRPLLRGRWGWGGPLQRRLHVKVGDALGESAVVEGGFAGLVVDLFSRGVVIPQLQQESTWGKLLGRLRPGGRVMVNCGGGCVEGESGDRMEGERAMWQTLLALRSALPSDQELLCRRLDGEGGNVLALSVGTSEDIQVWMDCRLPAQVVDSIDDWQPFRTFIENQTTSLQC